MSLELQTLSMLEKICSLQEDIGNYAVVILKPDFPADEIQGFFSFCQEASLRILIDKVITLDHHQIISLYHDLFNGKGDSPQFGISWKAEVLKYLTDGSSRCLLLHGKKAAEHAASYKYSIRERHQKITSPKHRLSPTEFNLRVVRNLVHSTDPEEFMVTCWTLFIS